MEGQRHRSVAGMEEEIATKNTRRHEEEMRLGGEDYGLGVVLPTLSGQQFYL